MTAMDWFDSEMTARLDASRDQGLWKTEWIFVPVRFGEVDPRIPGRRPVATVLPDCRSG